MAEKNEKELELDVDPPKNKATTILLIVLIVLVLLFGGVGAWFFLASDSNSSGGTEDKTEIENLEPLEYLTLTPEFIVNFGPGSRVRYLQVNLQVVTRDSDSLKIIRTYRPVLRNDILFVLSGLSFKDLRYRSGKEALQKKLLNTINKVIVAASKSASTDSTTEKDEVTNEENKITEEEVVEGPIINVYYTHFIMQ